MHEDQWALVGERVITPEGQRPAGIVMTDGVITGIMESGDLPAGIRRVDAGAATVIPGLVDTHVHLNEPGRTEWEGFETGTRAAAAGGITTLVDMPLNSTPVTTTLVALEAKMAAARANCWVDCGFWGGIVPGNAAELAKMIHTGVLGFKAFLCHSGIDDFPKSEETDLRVAMAILAAYKVPLLVHAELEAFGPPDDPSADPRAYQTFLDSRPAAMEVEAVRFIIGLCRSTGCAVHIVHLSAADALADIAAAKAEGLPLSVETCPHYLVLSAEEVPDGNTAYKCCPPIREAANRERLWAGLIGGTIDFVACDHSPCTPALKKPEEGDFMAAWGGIASVQLALPVVWGEAARRGIPLTRVIEWVAGRTAAFAGLGTRKGAIAVGRDADMALFHPDRPFTVNVAELRHRHPTTPYMGRTLQGVVERTYLRGEAVFDTGTYGHSAGGLLLARGGQAIAARV